MTFDSHCHLTAEAFDADRDAVLERARTAGVVGMVSIASTPRDTDGAVGIARSHADVWATAGVHPHESGAVEAGWEEAVARRLADPRVVAVGECGLEFHYDVAPRARQLEVLAVQVELARVHDLPLVVHSRDADEDMIGVLRELPPGVRGVLHCFTGGDGLLEAALAADWYVSFSGITTFKRFDGAERVRRVPAERILVETDSPYLAPVPYRGKRNEPAHVVHTTAVVAAMRGEPVEAFGERVVRNARAFYRLGGDA